MRCIIEGLMQVFFFFSMIDPYFESRRQLCAVFLVAASAMDTAAYWFILTSTLSCSASTSALVILIFYERSAKVIVATELWRTSCMRS